VGAGLRREQFPEAGLPPSLGRRFLLPGNPDCLGKTTIPGWNPARYSLVGAIRRLVAQRDTVFLHGVLARRIVPAVFGLFCALPKAFAQINLLDLALFSPSASVP